MTAFSQEKTVGEYVKEKPSLSRIFERYGIDYCCGGKKPLIIACQEKGLAPETVMTAIQQTESTDLNGEDLNWQESTIGQMIDHIYDRHHQYLYDVMPRLYQMVHKVARVHGEKDARLEKVAKIYDAIKQELEVHMHKEEQVLFPYCRLLDIGGGPSVAPFGHVINPIRVMESDHQDVGGLLVSMRKLTDDYMPPEWACNTYRALLDGLREMEADIHQHVHKENNILFPKVLMTVSL